jgi:hypothetical protein
MLRQYIHIDGFSISVKLKYFLKTWKTLQAFKHKMLPLQAEMYFDAAKTL